MKRNTEFHDYVMYDVLGSIPNIASKAMFSGYGIYKEGVIFALIIDGRLYFKTDEHTKKDFEARGSTPFSYTKKDGKTYTMRYWLLPEEIMENQEELAEWVECAVGVSGSVNSDTGR